MAKYIQDANGVWQLQQDPISSTSSGANIDPFRDIRESLPKGWKLFNAGADRMAVVSPSGLQANLGVRPYEEPGVAGRVWLSESNSKRRSLVVRPELVGTYMRDTGNVEWEGYSSSQNFANLLTVAERIAKQKRMGLQQAWNYVLTKGSNEDEISPAPSLAFNESVSSQRRSALSIALRMRSSGDNGRAWNEEKEDIKESYANNLGNVQRGIAPDLIRGARDVGGYLFSFSRLAGNALVPDKSGNLIPFSLQTQTPNASGVQLINDPSKILKNPKLSTKGNATPYNIDEYGNVQPIQPGVTTNFNRPAYAWSNVLDENDMPFAGRRMNMVLGGHPIPGAGTRYEDPREMKLGETFWGGQTSEFAPIKGVTVGDLLNDRAGVTLDDKLFSRTYGFGIPVSKLGTLTRQGQDPEDIKGRFGPSIFHASSASFVIPKYVNKDTWEAATPDEAFLTGKPSSIISTDPFTKQLQQKLGMNIIQREGTDMGLQLAGDLEAAVSIKGHDVKVGQYGTGTQQSLMINGQNVPISLHTAELKGPAIALGALGSKSPQQLTGIMRRFALQSGMNRAQAREFMSFYNSQYGDRAANGEALGISMSALSNEYARIMGTEAEQGGVFGARMYNTLFMNQSAQRNATNMRRFGEAPTGEGQLLFQGMWHPEQVKWLRNTWERGFRQNDKNATAEQIEAGFNQAFSMGKPNEAGFIPMHVRTGANDRLVQAIQPYTQEWVHGSGVGQEFQMGATAQFPEFARALGISTETFSAQGPVQRAKLGLAQYAFFQGQRRENYVNNAPMSMPTNVARISSEKLMQVAAYIGGAGKDVDSLEKLKRISEDYFGDVPEDQLLYNEESRSFVANPKSVLGATFNELGVKASAVARPYLESLQSLGEAVSPETGLTGTNLWKAGIEATSGFYNYISQIIGGSGNFLKGMTTTNVNQSAGGNYSFDPTLAPNQTWLPASLLKKTARQMGYVGGMVGKVAREILTKGAQTIGVRWPIPSQEGIQAGTLQTEQEKIAAMGEEAYRAQQRNPEFRNVAGMSGVQAQANIGDFDYDKFLTLIGVQRGAKGQLEFLNDKDVAANQMTLERASEIEERYFQNEQFRDLVNAPVQQLADMANPKTNVLGKALGNSGKRWDLGNLARAGFETFANSTLGMGVGYNPRRAAFGIMAASGYSEKEIANVLSSVPMMYQPALDKMLKGRFAGGMPAAAVIAKSYMGVNEESGQAYLTLASTGSGTRRVNRRGPNGEVLSQYKSPSVTLGLNELATNRMAMLQGTNFLVEQFSRAPEMSKGGDSAAMNAQQVAGWFALPGESGMLEERLKTAGRSGWNATVGGYYSDVINRFGLRTGLEKIYQTGAWGSVLTQARTKAYKNQDVVSGEEIGAPGATAAWDQFSSQFTDEFGQNFQASSAYNEFARKGVGSSLRNIIAGGINSMVRRFPETGVIGKWARSLARSLNVSQESPDDFDSMFPSVPEKLQDEMEYFQSRRYRDAVSNGYEGTLEDFQRMEQGNQAKMVDRSNARQYRTGGATEEEQREFAQLVGGGVVTKEDAARVRELGDKMGNSVPAAPDEFDAGDLPIAAGGDGDQGGGDGSTTTTAVPEPDDPRNRKSWKQRYLNRPRRPSEKAVTGTYKPKDLQQMAAYDGSGVSQRVGYDIRSNRALKLAAYNRNKPSFTHRLHEVLTGLGYEGEETNESIQERAQKARVEDPARFFGAFSPGELRQGANLVTLQQDLAYSQAFIDKAPGVGGNKRKIDRILAEAADTSKGLGQDIDVAGYLFKDMGGAKPYNLQSARGLMQNPAFRNLSMAMGGITANSGGVFGAEQMSQIKSMLAANPEFASLMTQAGKLSTDKNIADNFPEVAEVGAQAKAFKDAGGVLSEKKAYYSPSAESVERISKALDQLNKASTAAAEGVGKVTKREQDRLDVAERVAQLNVRNAALGDVYGQNETRIRQLIAKRGTGETLSADELKELPRLLTSQKTISKQMSETGAALEEAGLSTGEKWGSAARRMLGGFGLMYLSSIFGFATQGLGYGQDQRAAFDQAGAAGAYRSTGIADVRYNQEAQLNTQMALYGVNNDPRMSMKMFMTQNPLARDIWGTASAALGTWGYTQFAAGQIGGPAGKALERSAGVLGLFAGVGNLAVDAYSRSQDPNLAYRTATGRAGATDYLGLGMMGVGAWAEYLGDRGYAGINGSRIGDGSIEKLQSYITNRKFQGQFQQDVSRGLSTDELMSRAYGPDITQSDRYRALNLAVAGKYSNYSFEAQNAATGYLMRSGGSMNDSGFKNILSDYEMGGWAEKTALGGMSSLGFRPDKVFGKEGAAFQQYLASTPFDEAGKAMLSAGADRAGQLSGLSRVFGGSFGKPEDFEKATKFLEKLAGLSDSSFGVLQSQMQAYTMQQSAGLRSANLTSAQLMEMTNAAAGMDPAQAARATALASAQAGQAQYRLSTAGSLAANAARLGNADLGMSMYDMVMGSPAGSEWRTARFLNADPMMLGTRAQQGLNLGNLAGATTIDGRTINANYLAMTDRGLDGTLTGMSWGSSSLRLGSLSAETMGQRLFGGMTGDAVNAAVKGFNLQSPITLGSGRVVSQVGGQLGLKMYGDQLDYNYQAAQLGLQGKGLQQDYDYQMQVWAIQDQQRALGHRHQMAQFGFQERGLNLQQQSMQMNNRFFWANAGLQQQQTTMQRSWAREDWGYQDMTRNMQWGWKQEDFQEEARFMTGRQRRLAERQMRRDTTMHNLEEGQIDKQRGRQEELWKLEDERFKLQKQQHTEQYQMSLKNLALQRDQFEEQKKFYLESKKLEDQLIELQRKHWLEQHKLSKEQLAITQEHAKKTLELKKASDQLAIALQMTIAELNTLADDALVNFQTSITNTTSILNSPVSNGYYDSGSGTFNNSSSWTTTTTPGYGGLSPDDRDERNSLQSLIPQVVAPAKTASSSKQTINVYVGNEKLSSFVVDTVDRELRA